jgi:hypothetical protein
MHAPSPRLHNPGIILTTDFEDVNADDASGCIRMQSLVQLGGSQMV